MGTVDRETRIALATLRARLKAEERKRAETQRGAEILQANRERVERVAQATENSRPDLAKSVAPPLEP